MTTLTRPSLLQGVVGSSIVAAGLCAASLAAQDVTFRSSIDYIAVDVQVVDREGRPVERLGPDMFEVSINGKKRNVVTADFIRNTRTEVVEPAPTRPMLGMNQFEADPSVTGRVFMIAVDEASFDVGESKGVTAAIRGFISQLPPEDFIGIYSYPLGPKFQPTRDRMALIAKLGSVQGSRRTTTSQFRLTPSEVIDITARASRNFASLEGTTNTPGGVLALLDDSDPLRRVQLRECVIRDAHCLDTIQAEAQAMAFEYEARAVQSLYGLRGLVRELGSYPGRKTVVMMSGGMIVSDQLGGHPDVGELPRALGQEAAEANIAIYALHLDTSFLQMNSVRDGRIDVIPDARSRDTSMMGRLMADFSAASGGAFELINVGSGEHVLQRVLRETSAHYLLAVEPEKVDRDGKLHQLHVKVKQSGVTLRSRMWVMVPKTT